MTATGPDDDTDVQVLGAMDRVVEHAYKRERDEARAELARVRADQPVEGSPTMNGKWMCSTSEERWPHGEEFDTKEEALAYALSDFGAEHGLDHGDSVWIGQIREIAAADLASHGADAWRVIENLDERIFELVGDDFANELEVSKEAEADLDQRLEATIREWLVAHDIKPGCFTLEHIERHVWERCQETRPESPHAEQCVREIEHEGACEWP